MQKVLSLSALFIISIFCLACGGGSSGTDGGVQLRLIGKISSSSGRLDLPVRVTIEETGDNATTDQEGRFELITVIDESQATLLLEQGSREARASVNIEGAESGDTISIDLMIDEAEFSVASVEIAINPDLSPPVSTPVIVAPLSIEGSLRNEAGRPIPGFKVSVIGELNDDVTRRNGGFSIVTKQRKISLLISNRGHKARVNLGDIPREVRAISVDIVLSFRKPSAGELQTLDEASFKAKARVSRR